jgi:hypothetical protein
VTFAHRSGSALNGQTHLYRSVNARVLPVHAAGSLRRSGHHAGIAITVPVCPMRLLFLDGVYPSAGANPPVFRQVAAPSANELQGLVEQIAARVGQVLERRGLIERDIENAWLSSGAEAVHAADRSPAAAGARRRREWRGPRRRVFLACRGGHCTPRARVLERLCRYVSRPPVAVDRMALTASGQVRHTLKAPYRDGTTHIVLERRST